MAPVSGVCRCNGSVKRNSDVGVKILRELGVKSHFFDSFEWVDGIIRGKMGEEVKSFQEFRESGQLNRRTCDAMDSW